MYAAVKLLTLSTIMLYVVAYKSCKLGAKNLCGYRQMRLRAANDGTVETVVKILNKLPPLLGYYGVMLAPIYGIGLPFFGSMTDFNTVRNRISNNEIIVAPNKFTPNARAFEAPVFSCDADTLQNKFDQVILKQPRITYVGEDVSTRRKEYIQRSLIFRFPDVITYTTVPLGETKSTLAVHSYSVYGAGDLGVNRDRISSWLRDLVKVAPLVQSEEEDTEWFSSR